MKERRGGEKEEACVRNTHLCLSGSKEDIVYPTEKIRKQADIHK